MAGGDLRLNNRKLKVKALPKIFLILLKLILHHLTWVTNYTQVPTPDFKIMHPDNTVICQVKISRAAMKAAQEAAKAAKAPVKGKKNIFFSIISKSISCKTGAFFYLSSTFLDYFKLLLFQKHKHCLPTGLSRYSLIFVCQKSCQKVFITIRAILQPLYP
jgi:hypothetical protein